MKEEKRVTGGAGAIKNSAGGGISLGAFVLHERIFGLSPCIDARRSHTPYTDGYSHTNCPKISVCMSEAAQKLLALHHLQPSCGA
jgi:hypothetical protein